MALYRPAFLYSPLHRSTSLLVSSNPIRFFHKYSSRLLKPSKISISPTPISCVLSSSSELPSSMESSPEGYRRNVGICLINSEKKIFAASRLDIANAWQMPQGGIDEDEDPKDAAIRELKEETGVSSAEIVAEVPSWLTYDFPQEVREKIKIQWGSDMKGQAQKWFLFKFTGKDDEINLLGDGTEKPEFGEWAWMSPEQIIKKAVEFKVPVYEKVFETFSPHLQ